MPLQVEARSLRARRDRVRWALQLYVHAYSVAERQRQCLAIRHVTEMAPVTVLCPLRAAEHAKLSVGLLLSSQKKPGNCTASTWFSFFAREQAVACSETVPQPLVINMTAPGETNLRSRASFTGSKAQRAAYTHL